MQTFLVEFRGIHPTFRCHEFRDAYQQALLHSDLSSGTSSSRTTQEAVDRLSFTPFIADLLVPSEPACAYVSLPSEAIAADITRRCSLVRSVVAVWGQGPTTNETAAQALSNFPTLIGPIFDSRNNRSDNSWKVSFRRYGRGGKSGLDPQGKWDLLQSFAPVLLNLNGDVNMKDARHELLFLEDWSSWRLWDDARVAAGGSIADGDSGYVPIKSAFGKIICEGPNIMTDFDLKKRPFIGTTTMDAVCSHIAANAALISEGDLVLDPFCGTGSLLIAAAALGARVVGSDIDGDCLTPTAPPSSDDLPPLASTASAMASASVLASTTATTTVTAPAPASTTVTPSVSKNKAFQRFGAFNYSQTNKTTADNFEFYGMSHRLVALFGADVDRWTRDDPALDQYGQVRDVWGCVVMCV